MHSFFALMLPACGAISDIKESVSGLTNSSVEEALYVGVEDPQSDEIDLSITAFSAGATVKVWLADSSGSDDSQGTPITGAGVVFVSDANGNVVLADNGDGSYASSAEDDLVYAQGEETAVSATFDGASHKVAVTAPPPAAALIEDQQSPNEPLVVDLEGQDFDSVLVAVFDAGSGETTFSNEPQTVEDIYDFTHPDDDETLTVEIPGTAFPSESVYGVAVAGLKAAGEDGFTEVNTALSSYLAGQTRIYPVSTLPQP
jgi:hypothetical protein